ncbi:predicted protein [Botrytis cinerea T4]|uniref:Uncharacterized protein n=1 Tax=Botryotinia fuckeliana (strain T4) TaxID=999810 RepID=G2YYS1_BOTF4|nr:predicted protein [Botrytis cinerea T4]
MTAAEKILRAHDLESWVSSYSLVELEAYLGQLSSLSFQFDLSDPVLWGKAAYEMLKLI